MSETSVAIQYRPPAHIDYTDWRGVRRWRYINPITAIYGANELFLEPCWMLMATDAEVDERKILFFKMANIHEWRDVR
jgi:hypothetical protein